jgi:hypothetical protein
MKVFTFSNGKSVLRKNENRPFNDFCIMVGCFDTVTGLPLKFTEREATAQEIEAERIRVEEVEKEYQEVCKRNARIDRGNERLARATNHRQFMNAYRF